MKEVNGAAKKEENCGDGKVERRCNCSGLSRRHKLKLVVDGGFR